MAGDHTSKNAVKHLFFSLIVLALAVGLSASAPSTLQKILYQPTIQSDTTEYVVTEIEWRPRTYIGKRDTVSFAAMTDFFTEHLGIIYGGIQSAGMTTAGQPSGLYWHWDMENMRAIMAAAIPVDEATKMIAGYDVIEVPAGKALVTDYYGPYEQSAVAHEAIDAYVRDHAMPDATVVIEEYITDPASEPDASKWHTRITYVFVD